MTRKKTPRPPKRLAAPLVSLLAPYLRKPGDSPATTGVPMQVTQEQMQALLNDLNGTIVHQASTLRQKDIALAQATGAAQEMQRIAQNMQAQINELKAKVEKFAKEMQIGNEGRAMLGLQPLPPEPPPAAIAPPLETVPVPEPA